MSVCLTASAQWYTEWHDTTATGTFFVEQNSGTVITLTGSTIIIETTPVATGVVSPISFEITVVDSAGHYVTEFIEDYLYPSKEVCEFLFYYTAFYNGGFILTIYGYSPDYEIYSYGLVFPTYKLQETNRALCRKLLKEISKLYRN